MGHSNKVAVYARPSSERQGQRSVRHQIRNSRAVTRQANWTVTRIVSE